MRVALVKPDASDDIDLTNSNNYLDKFDLKFKYVPSTQKTLINKQKGMINLNENSPIQLGYGIGEESAVDVAKLADWSVTGGEIDTSSTCIFKPSKPGIYTITAVLKKGTVLPEGSTVEEDVSVTFTITVNGIFIVPSTYQMYVGDQKQFVLKYGLDDQAETEITDIASWALEPGGGLIAAPAFGVNQGPGDFASILNGMLTAFNATEKVRIIAGYSGMVATAEVTIKTHELKIEPQEAMLNLGQQLNFTAVLDGEAKGTGVTWSVLETAGGTISDSGLYTSPNQWGRYTIKAAYNGLETTAVAVVNNEAIRLAVYSYAPTVRMNSYQLGQTQVSTNADYITISLAGADNATLNLSSGASGGRFEYVGAEGNSYPEPKPWNKRIQYKYYPPAPDRPVYAGDETCQVTVSCAENTKAGASFEISINRPVQDTVETYYAYNVPGVYCYYEPALGEWVTENKTVYNGKNKAERRRMARYTDGTAIYRHGRYESWRKDTDNTYFGYGDYYCGQGSGTGCDYYSDGRKNHRYVYDPSFLAYDLSTWSYSVSSYVWNGSAYVPVLVTYESRYHATRASLTQGWQSVFVETIQTPGWPPPDIVNPVE